MFMYYIHGQKGRCYRFSRAKNILLIRPCLYTLKVLCRRRCEDDGGNVERRRMIEKIFLKND